MRVPLLNLTRLHAGLREELAQAWNAILASSAFILGEPVRAFEEAVARYYGVRYAVGVASGTDALILAQQAIGVGAGCSVITVPFTFVATASSILRLGAVPIFVDVDRDTYNISIDSLRSALDKIPSHCPPPSAIIPVHLYGLPADLSPLLEIAEQRKLRVIEDAAQAFGARYEDRPVGTFGVAGCLSFFPSKNLGGLGDGGMVLTDDEEIATTVTMLRQHGGRDKYNVDLLGYNSRLDALQAKLLSVKLPHVDEWNERRRRVAARLTEGLRDIPELSVPIVPSYAESVFNQYTIRCRNRDALANYLQKREIGTAIYYTKCLHQQKLFENHCICPVPLTVSETLAGEVLSLPVDPLQTEEESDAVIEAIREFYTRK